MPANQVFPVQIDDLRGDAVPREVQFNTKPTWGVSTLRDETSTTGTGASVAETGGEIEVKTGSDGTGSASLVTVERGQYRAGAQAETGVAVRIPTAPTGSQVIEWGYFDDNNGFGFGWDATGQYVFRRSGGTDTKVYSNKWSLRPEELSISDGIIFLVRFRWYGFGAITWHAEIANGSDRKRVDLHRMIVKGSVSIIDPNQPITVKASNGGTASSISAFVGGRQFSLLGGDSVTHTRPTHDRLSEYSITAAEGAWEPLIAFRRKANHNGRTNSVRCVLTEVEVTADNRSEFRVTYGDTTSGGTYSAPTGWTDAESAIETKLQGGSLTSTAGHEVLVGSVPANQRTVIRVTENQRVPLGSTTEMVLWARKMTNNATVIDFASITVEEQW